MHGFAEWSASSRGRSRAPRPDSPRTRRALTLHVRYPKRRRLHGANSLGRSLGEVRRRIKVIGPCPGETSCLNLCCDRHGSALELSKGDGVTPGPQDDSPTGA